MSAALANWAGQLHVLAAVVLAMALGGAVGFERETANRPAGLRTHMLVAGAAALLVGLGQVLIQDFAGHAYADLTLRIDPMRLIEAVVTAVGFLGAGTIFRHGGHGRSVGGLTTAASLLMVAVLGIAVGLAQYIVALGVTILALLVLRVVRRLEATGTRHNGH